MAPEGNPNPLQLLDTVQAAAVLGVSRQWLEVGRSKGFGPTFIRLKHAIRYRLSDLQDFIAERAVKPTESHLANITSARRSSARARRVRR